MKSALKNPIHFPKNYVKKKHKCGTLIKMYAYIYFFQQSMKLSEEFSKGRRMLFFYPDVSMLLPPKRFKCPFYSF